MLLSAAVATSRPQSVLVITGTILMILGIFRLVSLLTPWGRKAGFGNMKFAFVLGAALTGFGYFMIANSG